MVDASHGLLGLGLALFFASQGAAPWPGRWTPRQATFSWAAENWMFGPFPSAGR
jgi:hypothetical protein